MSQNDIEFKIPEKRCFADLNLEISEYSENVNATCDFTVYRELLSLNPELCGHLPRNRISIMAVYMWYATALARGEPLHAGMDHLFPEAAQQFRRTRH